MQEMDLEYTRKLFEKPNLFLICFIIFTYILGLLGTNIFERNCLVEKINNLEMKNKNLNFENNRLNFEIIIMENKTKNAFDENNRLRFENIIMQNKTRLVLDENEKNTDKYLELFKELNEKNNYIDSFEKKLVQIIHFLIFISFIVFIWIFFC